MTESINVCTLSAVKTFPFHILKSTCRDCFVWNQTWSPCLINRLPGVMMIGSGGISVCHVNNLPWVTAATMNGADGEQTFCSEAGDGESYRHILMVISCGTFQTYSPNSGLAYTEERLALQLTGEYNSL